MWGLDTPDPAGDSRWSLANSPSKLLRWVEGGYYFDRRKITEVLEFCNNKKLCVFDEWPIKLCSSCSIAMWPYLQLDRKPETVEAAWRHFFLWGDQGTCGGHQSGATFRGGHLDGKSVERPPLLLPLLGHHQKYVFQRCSDSQENHHRHARGVVPMVRLFHRLIPSDVVHKVCDLKSTFEGLYTHFYISFFSGAMCPLRGHACIKLAQTIRETKKTASVLFRLKTYTHSWGYFNPGKQPGNRPHMVFGYL